MNHDRAQSARRFSSEEKPTSETTWRRCVSHINSEHLSKNPPLLTARSTCFHINHAHQHLINAWRQHLSISAQHPPPTQSRNTNKQKDECVFKRNIRPEEDKDAKLNPKMWERNQDEAVMKHSPVKVWSSYLDHYMKGVLRGRNSWQSQRQQEEAEIQRKRSDGDQLTWCERGKHLPSHRCVFTLQVSQHDRAQLNRSLNSSQRRAASGTLFTCLWKLKSSSRRPTTFTSSSLVLTDWESKRQQNHHRSILIFV